MMRSTSLLALLFWSFAPICASADETPQIGSGTTFSIPSGLSRQSRPAPVTHSWRNGAGTLTVDVFSLPHGAAGLSAAVKEFDDWPGVGRSLAAGFGEANANATGKALNTKCTYEGVPIERDSRRMTLRVQVTTTCTTDPAPSIFRSDVIQVLTTSEQVLIRIDSTAASREEAEVVVAGIWKTLKPAPLPRTELRAAQASMSSTAAPVRGGRGLKLVDYGLTRPAALAGQFTGSIIAALGFGALLCLLFMRLGLRPMSAILLGQTLLLFVRLWGAEHDGVWELDWLVAFPTIAIATLSLRGWAQRKWDTSHRTTTQAKDEIRT